MYVLSEEAKTDLQSYEITGSVGTFEFDDDNILKGSLSFSNQCSDTSTFGLGGVYVGQMSCTFINMAVPRNEWIGKEISLSVIINGDDENPIPIGVYYIIDAQHTKGMTKITAYDAMEKFDKIFGLETGAYGSVYDLVTMACEACDVEFGMTELEVNALPNGGQPFVLEEIGDIETWRDFIFWVSVSLCGFATIDRYGHLVFRTYHSDVDDVIDCAIRYNTSTYGDEVATYTGVNIYRAEDEEVLYYANDPDDGYTLNLGENPFMQGPKAQMEIYIDNILEQISEIEYVPCEVSIPFGAHYDLGDVLQFPNGQGSATNKFCVIGCSWTYYGECKIKSIALKKSSKSKTDKNLQGILSTVSKNEFTSYELRNTSRIIINDGESQRLVQARIASNVATKAQVHIEVNLASVSSNVYSEEVEDFSDIWQGITESSVSGIITYLINSVEDELHPTETWIDGNHIMHLMYILPLEANTMNIFDVYMRSANGTITIEQGGVWMYASGAGLVGDGKWDGTIKLTDEIGAFEVVNYLSFSNISDNVSFIFPTNHTPTASDIIPPIAISNVDIGTVQDDVLVTLHADVFALTDETGENALVIEEDDETRLYTEGDEE